MTRAQKVARAQALRAEGLLLREVAERMGVALKTVSTWLSDPDLTKQRARRQRYRGTCIDCGAQTDGSNGYQAPKRCLACHGEHRRFVACDQVIAAMRGFAERYGRPPAATDWNPSLAIAIGHPERAQRFRDDGCWPNTSTVTKLFGSWNAALAAAGFSPNRVGRPRKVAA